MVRNKIILMLALYLILGVIAFFNFDFHHLLIKKIGEIKRGNKVTAIELQKNADENQKKDPREPKISSSDED
jgi:hypothetical protein